MATEQDIEDAQVVWATIENHGSKGGDVIAKIRAEAIKEAAVRICAMCKKDYPCTKNCSTVSAILGDSGIKQNLIPESVIKQNLTTESKPGTVKEIVADYLKKNGYDGLCRDGCGCGLDCFMPCSDEIRHNCKPAYARTLKCADCESNETCDYADNNEDKKVCYFTSKE